MGGRGASAGGRAGGGGGLNPSDIVSTTSFMSERGALNYSADAALQVFKDVQEEYGYVVEDIEIATLKARGANVLAYYDGSNIAFNRSYLSGDTMDKAYDACVASGFHPSRGNKTALQAVTAHELGHGLTDAVANKMGLTGVGKIDRAATNIVNEARKSTKHRGVVQMSRKISTYATHSNAEACAEAFADVYCNGKKARSESHAIVNVMNKYLGKGTKSTKTSTSKPRTKSATTKKAKAASLKNASRSTLEKMAIDAYVKKNASLGTAEATRRAKALMGGNTDAQLRKFITNNS